MADKVINTGGTNIFEPKNGYLQTVTSANTYKLDKNITFNFRLAPEYELIYGAGQDFDINASGNLGTWDTKLPLTHDVLSTKDFDSDTINDEDKNTLSYWLYELGHKRYPVIQFREIAADTHSPAPRIATINFTTYLTEMEINREKIEFPVKMSGLIKEFLDLKVT